MPGALDANGIWQYAEGDEISPWSDYMNKLASSVSTEIGQLNDRLDASPLTMAITPSSPWTTAGAFGVPGLVVLNGMCHLTTGLIVRPTALTVSNTTFQQFAQMPALALMNNWLPSFEVYGVGAVFANGSTPVPAYFAITPTGAIGFTPTTAVTFGAAGGATNSLRIPTISWAQP